MTRKYPLNVTLRDGRKAVVLGENPFDQDYPLIGYAENFTEGPTAWTESGLWSEDGQTPEYDIVSGLHAPEPASETPRTIKVRIMVGATSEGSYSAYGRRKHIISTRPEDLQVCVMEDLRGQHVRMTMVEADVPLPDEAIPTVQGRVVEGGE